MSEELDPYESELKKEKEAENERIEEAKDNLTEGKIREQREGEGTLDYRRRIYPDYKKKKKKERLPSDADIQTEGNLKGQPKPEDIFGEGYKGKPTYLDDPKDKEGNSFMDPESGFRTTLAIGTEVLGNTLLDLLSADPTQLTQVLGAQGINYFAQRIRGSEFSKGEMIAAGLASLIPGGAQAKSVAGVIGKTATRGAVSGAIETGAADLIDTGEIDPDNVLAGAGVGGAFGGILGSASTTKQASDLIQKFRARLRGGDFVPMDGTIDFTEGTIGAARRKRKVPGSDNPDQLGLFENEGDQFLYEKYKAQNKVIGTPLPKRQQAGRALRPSDFDDIIEEYPDITPDLIFNYIESTKAGRFGKGVRNPDTGRLKRNNRGLEGTLKFLNRKSAPDPNFDLSEIAAELSAEFNKTITPKTLSNIIDENVDQGTFTFKTQGMSEPIEIKSIDDLRKAYMGRVARYRGIPAFERGHVFAADNIIKDNKIKNLTDFKNNLEPEIARSIYAQLDDQALDELIKANVDGDFSNVESFYKQILAGNRSRKNLDDPDKVIAALYGRDYGLRESFLNFVYPNRSLNRLIPPDLKGAFTDLYKKELEMALLDYKGLTIGPAALDKIRANVAQEVLKSFPDVDSRFVLEQMTVASDKAFLKDMVDPTTGEAK